MGISSIGGLSWPLPGLTSPTNGQNLPGNSGASSSSADTSASSDLDSAAQKFINYANENPIQRWLQQHGITQKEFDAMTPEQKQKILAEIKQQIQEQMKERLGAGATPSSPSVDIVA